MLPNHQYHVNLYTTLDKMRNCLCKTSPQVLQDLPQSDTRFLEVRYLTYHPDTPSPLIANVIPMPTTVAPMPTTVIPKRKRGISL